MSSADDHSPEAYRTLFALIGAGMQVTALLLIAASALVAPVGAVVALGVVWVAGTVWSWLGFGERAWLPTAMGTLVAVAWVVVIVVTT